MQVLAAKAQVFSIILDAVRLGVLPPAPSWGAEDHLCPGMYLPPSAGDLDAKARLPFPSSACLSHQVLRVWLLNSSIESISGFWFPAGVYSLLPRKSLDATVAHSIIVGFCCQLGRKKRKQKISESPIVSLIFIIWSLVANASDWMNLRSVEPVHFPNLGPDFNGLMKCITSSLLQ